MTQLTSDLIEEVEGWGTGDCFPTTRACPMPDLDCPTCPFSKRNRPKFINQLKVVNLLEIDHVDVPEISETDKSSR